MQKEVSFLTLLLLLLSKAGSKNYFFSSKAKGSILLTLEEVGRKRVPHRCARQSWQQIGRGDNSNCIYLSLTFSFQEASPDLFGHFSLVN